MTSSSFSLGGAKLNTSYIFGTGANNKPLKDRTYGVAITKNGTQIASTFNTYDKLDRLSSVAVASGQLYADYKLCL